MKRSPPTVLASLLALWIYFAAQPAMAEERPAREKIRVEWAPSLSQFGYIIVKGDEAVPLVESFGESGTVRRMLEDCPGCRTKLESSRKNVRMAAVLSGFALGGILGGIALFPAKEKVGVFLPVAVMITGYGLMFPAVNAARSAQQDMFDAVRIYNAQTP